MGEIVIADLRYGMAVILVVTVPIDVAFWTVIHGGIRFWQARPIWMAYTAALIGILAAITPILLNLHAIIGADMGHNPLLLGVGTLLWLSSLRVSSRVRESLSFRTSFGIPEIKNETGALIESGAFEVIRHPRYFMVMLSTVGWVIATNFAGAYVTGAIFLLGLYLIIQVEERELIARFGRAYLDYRKRVPMVIPKPAQIGRLFV